MVGGETVVRNSDKPKEKTVVIGEAGGSNYGKAHSLGMSSYKIVYPFNR